MITTRPPSTRVFRCNAWLQATGRRCGEWVSDGTACRSEGEHSDRIKITIGRASFSIDPAHFGFRMLQELMADALPEHWRREAERFDAIAGCRPLPLIVAPSTLARAPEAAKIALACRRHAWVLEQYGPPEYLDEEILTVLGEAA